MKVYMGVGDECYAHFEDINTIIFDFESQFNIEEFQQAYSHVYIITIIYFARENSYSWKFY